MLVNADAIEAAFRGEGELLDIFLVEIGAARGIVEGVRKIDPIGVELVSRLEIEMAVGHEMEGEEFHALPPRARRIAAATSAGRSTWAR